MAFVRLLLVWLSCFLACAGSLTPFSSPAERLGAATTEEEDTDATDQQQVAADSRLARGAPALPRPRALRRVQRAAASARLARAPRAAPARLLAVSRELPLRC